MADPPKIYGFEGRECVKVMIPRFDHMLNIQKRGWETHVPNKADTTLGYGNLTKLEHPRMLRDDLLKTNHGAERGVLPCKSVYGHEMFGRKEGADLWGWMSPNQGLGRNERRGLAYENEAPLNKPLTKKPYSYNVALNSKISIR